MQLKRKRNDEDNKIIDPERLCLFLHGMLPTLLKKRMQRFLSNCQDRSGMAEQSTGIIVVTVKSLI